MNTFTAKMAATGDVTVLPICRGIWLPRVSKLSVTPYSCTILSNSFESNSIRTNVFSPSAHG